MEVAVVVGVIHVATGRGHDVALLAPPDRVGARGYVAGVARLDLDEVQCGVALGDDIDLGAAPTVVARENPEPGLLEEANRRILTACSEVDVLARHNHLSTFTPTPGPRKLRSPLALIRLDTTYLDPFLSEGELDKLAPHVRLADRTLLGEHEGPGSDYHGWLDLPTAYDRDEFARVKAKAAQLAPEIDVLVVIGIGGSYLGTRAALHALQDSFSDSLTREERGGPQIVFAGTQLSARYHKQLLSYLDGKRFAINVISKSGTTTEPALAFRMLRKELERRHGADGARDLIVATTDGARGKLYELANAKGYERYLVPDDVGGRYSVLTAVGLFPLAVAGIDVDALLAGAAEAQRDAEADYADNACLRYAAARFALYQRGKLIELFVAYDPRFQYVAEWWKQLFGESEGKDHKALYPASAQFTTDLHSLGQYIQEGRRHLMETVVLEDATSHDLPIEEVDGNPDGLNYLAGKGMHHVNEKAAEGTLAAHRDGQVPNVVLRMPELDAHGLGYLFYFFERACAVSAYMLGVNPFDQPGVEAYKSNMFALLGKPGA